MGIEQYFYPLFFNDCDLGVLKGATMLNKVLFVSSLFYPNVGGVENSIREMSRELQARGVEVTIVSSDRNFVSSEILKKVDEFEGAKLYRCNYPYGIFGLLVFFVNFYKLGIKLNTKSFDLVVVRSHWPAIVCKLVGFKNVSYIVPSVSLFQERLSAKFFFSKAVFRTIFNAVGQFFSFLLTRVYVFSETMHQQVRSSTLGLVKPKIVNPGVSRTRFKRVSADEKIMLRRNLGLGPEDVVILGVGRFSEVKQFDIAIKSMQFLPQDHKLILVGGGSEYSNYVRLIEECGLEGRVFLFPFVEDTSPYYQSSDVYVMSSRYESFGQVLLEATSCGLPVAAFSNEAGVNTAVGRIYKDYGSLVSFSKQQSAESIAKAIERAKKLGQEPGFNDDIECFSISYDWHELILKIG